MGKARSHLDHGIENEVDHQRKASPIAIGHQSKDERSHRTEHERQRDGKSDGSIRAVKFLSDRRQRKDNQEKVESIQRPAKEPGKHRRSMAVMAVFSEDVFAGTIVL